MNMTPSTCKDGNKEIFQWMNEEMTILCETCLQYIAKHSRAQFFAWKEIQQEVKKKIGRQCGANSCKYKYDTMKNDWRLWKQLKILETVLGWNPVTGKIEASDEWWMKKIEENKKFHNKGVDPFLEEKCDELFGDSYATGKNVYTPSMEPSEPIILENDEEDESSEDDGNGVEEHIEAYNFQNNPYLQSTLMNEKTFMTQFIKDISIPTQDTITQGLSGRQTISQSGKGSTWKTKGKEKVILNNNSVQMKRQRRQSRGSAMVSSQLADLVSMCRNISQSAPNSGTTQQSMTNIATSMQIIRSMVEHGNLVQGSELWGCAIHLLENSVRQELFINLGDDDSRLQWLEYMYGIRDKMLIAIPRPNDYPPSTNEPVTLRWLVSHNQLKNFEESFFVLPHILDAAMEQNRP
ncbi:LOW QUALITY PROTEIN: hypothetical protein Cgig2_023693 [Carnegiea gigantea]|uniref:Myb/SANT-like domain-containing protein n=1 Tax=Carnegiea gigantea TaxID=171969 RepID=A0A9Q1QLP1_9CARY|nr:LOW QUALITY PROTEIN: hypothetical protein Cgig2_023693 [Carnegiea gigantea]